MSLHLSTSMLFSITTSYEPILALGMISMYAAGFDLCFLLVSRCVSLVLLYSGSSSERSCFLVDGFAVVCPVNNGLRGTKIILNRNSHCCCLRRWLWTGVSPNHNRFALSKRSLLHVKLFKPRGVAPPCQQSIQGKNDQHCDGL